MEYLPSYVDILHADIKPSYNDQFENPKKYGIPSQKKFPMPDAAHVRSAIKFFNYVTPSHEQELAVAILKRMKEYGINVDSVHVGEKNRFRKYLANAK